MLEVGCQMFFYKLMRLGVIRWLYLIDYEQREIIRVARSFIEGKNSLSTVSDFRRMFLKLLE